MSAVSPHAALPAQDLLHPLATATAAARPSGPVGRAVALVYGTCALLAVAYPQALAAWLDEFEPNPVVAIAQSGTARLVAISEGLGVARISGQVRDLGKQLTRKPD